ncbi:hypothetical protein [Sideroxydans lithotrophicus]|uniref:Uncharacterized protein n=1 Tax=Sideroxydans lithotrophicus (strain ES-1) TaxID=580332 RepID=D5CSZ7_SIDLE|nr:hypothetical protein [Sideroxydans lithotrophicus]ADE12083.1 hypothetical protein Slit_1854 [Sideroxydans lithotrophicus ES-1]
MRSYFPVDVRDENSIGVVADYRFLFKSPGVISATDLADCLEQSLRRVLLPDALVFVCIPKETQQILDVFNADNGVKQALERASSKVCVAVCEIDRKGNIGKPTFVKNARGSLPLIDEEKQEQIFQKGVGILFDSPNVLCPAPSGFAFVKPSKKRSKYFLRADAAFYETERVHFLAYALLSRIAKREDETKEPIAVIFIDTMAIASLAYVLRELYHELYEMPRPRVESFHSYGGMENVDKPMHGTSLCIISASSSMSMQRDWQQLTRCFPSEIFTLITLKDAKDSEQAIYAFDKSDSLNNHDKLSGLRDLRIVGESFIPEDVPLKSVLFTVRAHRDESWFEVGQKYSESSFFSLMKAAQPKDKVRPIFVDGQRLFEYKKFQEFLEKDVMQKVPLSVQAVICQDDEASIQLAEICAKRILEIRGGADAPRVIKASNFEGEKINRDEALLIVAAVVGRGTRLLSISRDLRDIHTGARHYLIGFQLGESICDCEQLQSNLKFSATKSSITVSFMESLAVGQTVGIAYEVEKALFSKWKKLSDFPLLKNRVNELQKRSGIAEGAFLPATLQGSNKLMLRTDFAYWKAGYSTQFDHSIAVLLTAAAMLQRAREFTKFKDDGHRLSSDTFQQVVLDPENFARYNDGVIQSALLRAAHPSELDYSSGGEVSRRMTDILSGVFRLNSRQQGEAALEFAFALKAERLKLADEDMNRLKLEVKELSGDGIYVELLKALLDVGHEGSLEQETGI